MIIDKYFNIPYYTGGRDFRGCDCWGFCVILNKTLFNIDLPIWNIDEVFDINQAKEKFVEVTTPQDGDIVLMRSNTSIAHTGIVVENTVIHMTKSGVSQVNLPGPHKIGFYRLKH